MLLVTSPHHVEEQFESVEWTTIIFFAGLFIMIHGLEFMGLIEMIADLISDTVSKASPDIRLMVVSSITAFVNFCNSIAFIDNIPYTATMVPVNLELASDPTLDLALGYQLGYRVLMLLPGGNGTITIVGERCCCRIS